MNGIRSRRMGLLTLCHRRGAVRDRCHMHTIFASAHVQDEAIHAGIELHVVTAASQLWRWAWEGATLRADRVSETLFSRARVTPPAARLLADRRRAVEVQTSCGRHAVPKSSRSKRKKHYRLLQTLHGPQTPTTRQQRNRRRNRRCFPQTEQPERRRANAETFRNPHQAKEWI